MQARAISSTCINVTWEDVRRSDQNGDITGYTVYYQAIKGSYKNGEEKQKGVSDGRATDTELKSLEEYVEYSIRVLASNGAGDGPKSAAVYKRTHEASMCRFSILCKNNNSFLHSDYSKIKECVLRL